VSRVFAVLLLTVAVGCDTKPATPATWGPPARTVRFASYNTFKSSRGRDAVLADIRSKSPDIVLLQEVPVELPEETARALGMYHAFRKHLNYPGEGIAIYSRWPLQNIQPVVDKGGRTCGLFADIAMDGTTFTVATVHLTATTKASLGNVLWSENVRGEQLSLIRKAWADRGSHPVIIAGDFNQVPIGLNYSKMTAGLKDSLAWIGKSSPTLGDGKTRLRVDYFLCSKEWKPLDGGVVVSDASDHDMIWMDITSETAGGRGASGASTTQPATLPVSRAPRRSTPAGAGSFQAVLTAGR
jgi:endonuclease/exonuclease/phosphatase (EEP) superfamily protein YafD